MNCKEEGCTREVYSKAWCHFHYQKLRERPQCSVEGCEVGIYAGGVCNKHYTRLRRHGDALANYRLQRQLGPCEVPGCEREAQAKNLCTAHYAKCRNLGIERSPDALREYEVDQALSTLNRYGVVSTMQMAG